MFYLFCAGYYFKRIYQPWGTCDTDFTVFTRAAENIAQKEDIYQTSYLEIHESVADPEMIFRLKASSVSFDGNVHINKYGYRGPSYSLDKPAGTKRIICLGGSNVFGFDLSDNETWPAYLEQELRQRFSANVEVWNGGVPAYVGIQMAKVASEAVDDIEADVKTVNKVKVLAKKVAVDQPAALRDLADRFKDKIQSGIVVLGSASGNKAMLIVIVSKDLTDRFHAGKIVKQVAAVVGGGGGGRPDMAQAGGSKPEKLDAALEKVYEIVEQG